MEINFRDFFLLMLRRIPVLILGIVIGFSTFFAYTKITEVPQYKSEVTMFVNAAPNTYPSTGNIAASEQLTKAYIGIMKDLSFAEKIVNKLPSDIDITAKQVRNSMTIGARDQTQILAVTVTTYSARVSYEIAKAIEEIAPNTLTQYFDDTGSIRILSEAKKAKEPEESYISINSALGALVGLVLSACVILLVAKLDRRIRSEEDIRVCTKYPILGTISAVE